MKRSFCLALLAIIALAGCGPAPIQNAAPVATAIPTLSVQTGLQTDSACPPSVLLPDGADIFLRTNSRIQVVEITNTVAGQPGDEVMLFHGEIVINSLLPAEKWVEVSSPNGFIARLAGRVMIVAYEGVGGQFTVACVDGACKIGPDAQRLTDLAPNSQGTLDKDGTFLGPFAISLHGLPASCETVFTSTPVPSRTATPVPSVVVDVAGTATAACQAFLEQFPLTPTCP